MVALERFWSISINKVRMHKIEPFFKWRELYTAENDEYSPFYGNTYSEFTFETTIYNYYIHPQWDSIDSESLYIKLLYADYEHSFAIIELLGEWNDCIANDIELLRKNLVDVLIQNGIYKFILLGENVFNFHGEYDDYYQDWLEEISLENGWIVGLNFREHVIDEMSNYNITAYFELDEPFSELLWRKFKPIQLFRLIEIAMSNRLM